MKALGINTKSFEVFYNNMNFVHGTCSIAWNIDEKTKKALSMPNKEQRKRAQPWRPDADNMVYVMAEESNLTVIDIDDAMKCKQLTRLCCQYCKYHVKTKKGFHFYFKRCNEFGIKLESGGLGFDLPALLYAPPGFYETDSEIIEYKFTVAWYSGDDEGLFGTNSRDLKPGEEVEVVEMPQVIVDEIKRLLGTKSKPKQQPKQQQRTNETRTVILPVIHDNTVIHDNKFQKYREFLVLIQHRNQEYEAWRNVGFALHQVSDTDEMYEVFAEWSQVDYSDYDDTATQNLWQHCKDDQENRITFGTLIHWAKEDNPDGYRQWNNKWGLGKLKYLVNNFDQAEAAKYFHGRNKNKYVYKESDGCWYMLEDNGRWRKSRDAVGFINTLNDFFKTELYKLRNHYSGKISVITKAWNQAGRVSDKEKEEMKTRQAVCESKYESITKICKLIGSVAFRKATVTDLMGLYLNEQIQFDSSYYLLGFNDGVYNLNTSEFRQHLPEDYITKSVRYNYSDMMEVDTELLTTLINQILPDEETRQCWFSVICTALEGRTLERFTIFNGEGRNGKGLLDEILLRSLGWVTDGGDEGYAATLSPAVLCAPIINNGPNPEIAKLNKMRLVISSEAPAGSMFNNTVIKQLTGGSYINGRFCHSNKTAVNLQCTLISECNDPPPFREKVTDAEIERLIDILFPCKFTENEDEIDEEKKVFRCNRDYKTAVFQNVQKFAMMKILLNMYAEMKGKIYLPESVRERSLHYAVFSHWAFKWYNENYRLLENPSKNNYITLQSIYEEVTKSDIYNNLTRTEKRAFTKKSLIDMFSKSPIYKKYYRERYQPRRDEKKINATNVLIGFVRLNEDGDPIIYPNRGDVDPTIV